MTGITGVGLQAEALVGSLRELLLPLPLPSPLRLPPRSCPEKSWRTKSEEPLKSSSLPEIRLSSLKPSRWGLADYEGYIQISRAGETYT